MEKYQAKEGYILRTVAGSNVLISVGNNIANFNGYIKLNDTAAHIWKELQEPKSLEELTESICAEFDIDKEQASQDAEEFLDQLIKEEMVVAA